MRKTTTPILATFLAIAAVLLGGGCDSVDDDRIPSLAVNINLAGAGQWNTYGVSGVGIYRYFILSQDTRLPAGYSYSASSATGFGGVLLIGGVDAFTQEQNVPLAYDLACPVECKATIRVAIDPETLEAVCPVCGSHYNVVMAGGSPVSGPALTGDRKYGLRRYRCLAANGGGYVITN